ncbi:MAG: hypothetical protein M0R80_03225 [Proteobacteria bacterium]|jgi:hypothetical protein|nr:hypothetical protein [Pseudomonadota bacterium]
MIAAGNPVAKNPPQVESINNIIKSLQAKWVEENPPPKWWQFWKKVDLRKVVKFILAALDEMIIAVEKEIASGPEKKAIVLAACVVVYEFVVANALPTALKPFSTQIENFIIYIVIASAIDWVVEKYRNGSWSAPSSSASSISSSSSNTAPQEPVKNVRKPRGKKRGKKI